MPLTKIVCTLGPATESLAVLREMVRAGMTVARLNFSHGTSENKRETAALVRQAAAEEGRYVALMGDLQGPKIRVGRLPESGVLLQTGEEVILTSGPVTDLQREIPFPHPDIIPDVAPGNRLLLDDGALELEVVAVTPITLRCRVCVGGWLTSHKGVNLPGVALKISALTEKDKSDALLALELDLDYLALSFVRRAVEVEELRAFLRGHARVPETRHVGENPHYIPGIVAKIEKPEALEDLDAIVRAADAVMVARGDLGVETAPERVPLVQKHIISLCNRLSKPVITATQMLQSMIEAPRPTRAEASDVANAILDGSDAVMLSGETSVGKYPVAAVQMMARIAESVEASDTFPYNQLLDYTPWAHELPNPTLISTAVSRATVVIAQASNATAILTSTESGRTPRMVARHRPQAPLLGITPFEETARRLQLVWGVIPILVTAFTNTDEMLQFMVGAATGRGYARVGDNVILTAGIPLEVHGVTNMLKVHTVREEDL
ncbi:MAG: pyruvate kinase [Anaerolineae bacterium]|nr:pyruvate kinase [Anaerolineae bacterium]